MSTDIREPIPFTTERAVRYAYSTDSESYHGSYASREEALVAGTAERKEYLCDEEGPVWTAVRIEADLGKIVRSMGDYSDQIIESLCEAAGEDYGEFVGDWPDTTMAQRQRLDEALQRTVEEWLRAERLTPAFFTIDSDSVERVR